MIIVIDTNIWLSELGLNSYGGAALRFFMREKGARLALPEVVRLEVTRHLRKNLHEQIETIKKNHRSLLAIFGKLKNLVLPTDSEIEGKVDGFFESLSVETIDVPFSLESARSSLLKTIDKLPPSDRDQQFKDGVIWADSLSLLDRDDVVLVTSDKAFYHDRKYENGLAQNLAREAGSKVHTLAVHHELGELLKAIEIDIDIADDEIASAISSQSQESLRALLAGSGFALGARASITKRIFITERPDVVFVECAIDHECIDTSGESRTDAHVCQMATGMYDLSKKRFQGIRMKQEALSFLLPNGNVQLISNVYGSIDIHAGQRDAVHIVRYPMKNP